MLEIIGVLYVAFSTYKKAKDVQMPAVPWFVASLAGYAIITYGIQGLMYFVLAQSGIVEIEWYVRLLVSLIFVGLGVFGLFKIQEIVEDLARNKRVDENEKTRKQADLQKEEPFVGKEIQVNYSPSKYVISTENSALENNASILVSVKGSKIYIHQTIRIERAEFKASHDGTVWNLSIDGKFESVNQIQVKVVARSKEDEVTIEEVLTRKSSK